DLQLLVVPSRVETRDDALLTEFRGRFEKLFASFTPQPLADAGLTYWDLMIPYDPRSAFQEGVAAHGSRVGTRSAIHPAMQKLVTAIALRAEPAEPVRRLGVSGGPSAVGAAEAQYDITTREAGYDVFLAYCSDDAETAGSIAEFFDRKGLRTFFDRKTL